MTSGAMHQAGSQRMTVSKAMSISYVTDPDPGSIVEERLQEAAALANEPHNSPGHAETLGQQLDEEQLPPPVPPQNRPVGEPVNNDFVPRTEELWIALTFKKALEAASFDNGDLDDNQIFLLQNPTEGVPVIEDNALLLSLKLFMSTTLASEQVYSNI
jgi:hypothetical protein